MNSARRANDLARKIRRCRNLTDHEKELLARAIESAPSAIRVIENPRDPNLVGNSAYALGAWQTVTDALTVLVSGEPTQEESRS